MYPQIFFFALLLSSSSATPLQRKRQFLNPSVTIQNGTVVGSSTVLIDTFNGIPYAQPPTGSLRLKPPQSITQSFGTFQATGLPNACPQMFVPLNTSALPAAVAALVGQAVGDATGPQSEDCLTLNVQRPSTATATSKLPVVFWIYGGGFEFGATQTYDGSLLISKSISLGHPIIFVAVNYRTNGYGFLAGQELQKDGSTNLGLRDQRLGLEWVAENIAAFGGDPDKVVIWGESAGSISVFDHTIINGGDYTYKGKPLFRGAVMDSGSVVPAVDVASPKAQSVYDTVVAAGGCSQQLDTLACLRQLPFETFNEAVNSLPGIFSYSSVDLSYLPRPDPSNNFFAVSPEVATAKAGRAVAKVPIIIGDQQDEGTLFSLFQNNVTTTDELIQYLAPFWPNASPSLIAALVATYPESASAGSPFGTGDANEIYPQFKRIAALLGDFVFTLTRRGYLTQVSKVVPAWSYLSTYFHGTPVLGTFHASDILQVFYSAPNPIPANSILTYYISFFNFLDPNMIGSQTSWPQWKGEKELMEFGATSNSIIKDNFRQKSYKVLASHRSAFAV